MRGWCGEMWLGSAWTRADAQSKLGLVPQPPPGVELFLFNRASVCSSLLYPNALHCHLSTAHYLRGIDLNARPTSIDAIVDLT